MLDTIYCDKFANLEFTEEILGEEGVGGVDMLI